MQTELSKSLCNRVTAMFGGIYCLQETDKNCFELKVASKWLQEGAVPVVSDKYINAIRKMLFAAGHSVYFNNTKTVFWIQ